MPDPVSGPFQDDYAEHPILPQRVVTCQPSDDDRVLYDIAYGQGEAEKGVARCVDRHGTMARVRAIVSDELPPPSGSFDRTLADIRGIKTSDGPDH